MFNLTSCFNILEKYQKMENEKKTKRTDKKVYSGPIIQYKSTKMPVLEQSGGV